MYRSASIPHWPLFPVRSNELSGCDSAPRKLGCCEVPLWSGGLSRQFAYKYKHHRVHLHGVEPKMFVREPERDDKITERSTSGCFLKCKTQEGMRRLPPVLWMAVVVRRDVRISLCDCVVSAAICALEHIRHTVRPVSAPPSSPGCLPDAST